MKKDNMHIVQLGVSGFPVGLAQIEKLRLLGRALLASEIDVTVICTKGTFDPDNKVDLQPKGVHEGIKYVYTSGDVYRPKSFVRRNLKKLNGKLNEFLLIQKLARSNNLDAAMVHSMSFLPYIYYRFLAFLFNFHFLYLLVELNSSLPERQTKLGYRIGDYLLENYGFKLSHGVFPISDKLLKLVNKKAKNIPCLKIPVICEYAKFEVPKNDNNRSYFLYCGSAVYHEVIYFILDAFDQISDPRFYLYLVINGAPNHLVKIKSEIAKRKNRDRILTFSELSYTDLIQKYLNAKALLIPLRFTDQDESRFPHKVGEYLASGNPMITTNVGEIRNYFIDGHTAIIANDYSTSEFGSKMQFVIENPKEAEIIGERGKEFGMANFDYPIYGKKIKEFVLHLNSDSTTRIINN